MQLTNQLNTGAALGFGNALLLDSVAKVRLSDNAQTLDQWFNINAFNRNSAQQLGSNLRALSTRFSNVRSAGVEIWDVSALKSFQFRERWRLQFRAELLNALNHSNVASPNTDPVNAVFGKVTATVGFPRYIHFGLKLTY